MFNELRFRELMEKSDKDISMLVQEILVLREQLSDAVNLANYEKEELEGLLASLKKAEHEASFWQNNWDALNTTYLDTFKELQKTLQELTVVKRLHNSLVDKIQSI